MRGLVCCMASNGGDDASFVDILVGWKTRLFPSWSFDYSLWPLFLIESTPACACVWRCELNSTCFWCAAIHCTGQLPILGKAGNTVGCVGGVQVPVRSFFAALLCVVARSVCSTFVSWWHYPYILFMKSLSLSRLLTELSWLFAFAQCTRGATASVQGSVSRKRATKVHFKNTCCSYNVQATLHLFIYSWWLANLFIAISTIVVLLWGDYANPSSCFFGVLVTP